MVACLRPVVTFLHPKSNHPCPAQDIKIIIILSPQPRQSKTYQADWTRWQLIFLSQEVSQRQEVIECDDRQLPWKMSSWVHQEVAPGQIPRYSPPILLVTWYFQRGRIHRLLSGSSAINKFDICFLVIDMGRLRNGNETSKACTATIHQCIGGLWYFFTQYRYQYWTKYAKTEK